MIPHFPPAELQAVQGLLSEKKNIVVTTHHKPDGDALGSSLALMHFLRNNGHNVQVVSPSEAPDFLLWMDGSSEVVDYIKSPRIAQQLLQHADIIFCLDFNDARRVERMQGALVASKARKILIDHHLDPQPFCDYVFSFPKSCATAEIVYHFMAALQTDFLTKPLAQCLYAGLLTDTGGFRFDSVSSDTHTVVAALMKLDIQHQKIHDNIYDSFSEMRMRFLGHCLKEKLVVLPEYKTAYFSVSKAEMEAYNHQPGDLEGIVNFALSIKGIKMAALFSERDEMVKISFRSKDDFSVKDLAEKHFEGGGHKNASGGKSSLSLQDTVAKFVKILPGYAESLQ